MYDFGSDAAAECTARIVACRMIAPFSCELLVSENSCYCRDSRTSMVRNW